MKARTTSAPKTVKSNAVAANAADANEAGIAKAASATKPGVTTASARPPKPAPSHEEIARRSYELYLARGGEPGHAEEDWLAAERELNS